MSYHPLLRPRFFPTMADAWLYGLTVVMVLIVAPAVAMLSMFVWPPLLP